MDENPISRRQFVLTGVSAGFALAVQPITAYALSTDTVGLEAGPTEVESTGGKIPAYWAMPKGKKALATIVVVHEIFGVHEHIQDVCRRLAKEGYLAIAPDLFHRQGDVTKIKEIPDIMKIVGSVPAPQVMQDLDATHAFAKASGHSDGKRFAITGFCWGGRATWLYAAHNPTLKAAAAWYGPLVAPPSPAPIDSAASLKVPVLGLYGGLDAKITQEHVTQMKAALQKGKSGSEIIVYPNSPHAFFADYRDSYRKADAEDGYKRMLGWFKKHGC